MRDDQLTRHFHLSEFTASGVAERHGIRNEPVGVHLDNLRRLARLLELVRANLGGHPLVITSGYRCAQLNALVGGSKFSAHMEGRAADFICPGFGTPRETCQQLVTYGVPYDQLIYEGTWVHIGIAVAHERPRQQALTAIFERGQPTRYLRGIA